MKLSGKRELLCSNVDNSLYAIYWQGDDECYEEEQEPYHLIAIKTVCS